MGGYTPEAGEDMQVDRLGVSAGFFETLGMDIEEGRAFDLQDVAGAPLVVIVNEAFAERFWLGRNQNPLGGTIRGIPAIVNGGLVMLDAEVVGIVADANYRAIGEEVRPAFFASLDQRPSTAATLLARTAPGRAPALLAEIRSELRAIDLGDEFLDFGAEAGLGGARLEGGDHLGNRQRVGKFCTDDKNQAII